MPFAPKQATAAFLNIRRREGLAVAKQFADKHKKDLSKAKGRYRPRSDRSK